MSSNVQTHLDSGTVVVEFMTPVSTPTVWQALTEPEMVSQWFGTLILRLGLGENTRLDFGDGDFFSITVTRFEPPSELEYTWRFLGIAPQDTITWQLIPQAEGCCVRVCDRQPARSPTAVQETQEGWLDFTERLRSFLATGTPTRYDWRREIDVSIELSCDAEMAWNKLFSPETQSQWLPIKEGIPDVNSFFVLTDGIEPSEIQFTNVVCHPLHQLQCQLTYSNWLPPTDCLLKLTAHNQGTLLSVSHVGWEDICVENEMQFQQRSRFCNFWIAALQKAQQLTHESVM